MKSNLEREFVQLLEVNQRIVHKVCRIYADNPAEHEDLFQEIAIQLWKSFPGFRGDAKFSTWMYRIALNTAITLFRKTNRSVETSSGVDFSTLRINNEESYDEEEKLKKMYHCIHLLSDIDKALIMMYLDDKPGKEIAEILGISEGNARVKMNRAKNNLKTLIQK